MRAGEGVGSVCPARCKAALPSLETRISARSRRRRAWRPARALFGQYNRVARIVGTVDVPINWFCCRAVANPTTAAAAAAAAVRRRRRRLVLPRPLQQLLLLLQLLQRVRV